MNIINIMQSFIQKIKKESQNKDSEYIQCEVGWNP